MVKPLGRRFTLMSPESDIGGLFETLYGSGLYRRFLGLTQVAAGLLVLSNATATAGAMLFFGIMLNVFVTTLSYDFHFTPVVTGLMLLATLYLLLWDYDRLRGLFGLGTDLADGEAAFFTSASDVTVQPLAGVGHVFNTHFRNHEGWRLMDEWLRSRGLGR